MTGYAFNDTNNHWMVLPTKEIPDSGRGRIVRHRDVVQFLHVNTDTILMSHDVASPLMATNTEFTTHDRKDETRYNDTLFRIEIDDAHEGMQWKTKSGHFRLMHEGTHVAMWTHSDIVLPEWGMKQQEVNGNKNALEKANIWFVDEIAVPDSTLRFSA